MHGWMVGWMDRRTDGWASYQRKGEVILLDKGKGSGRGQGTSFLLHPTFFEYLPHTTKAL